MGRKKLKLTLILALLLFTASCTYSQHKYAFSMGIDGGFTLHQNRTEFAQKTTAGFNYGIDFEARRYNFSMFLESTYNPENQNNDGILELSAGPRWLLGGKEFFSSIDAGLGLYKFRNSSGWGAGYMGLNIGAGVNFMVSAKSDIFLKAKYHFVGVNYVTSYSVIDLGLRYYFKK